MTSAQTVQIAQIDASGRKRPVDPIRVEFYRSIADQRLAEGLSPLVQPIVIRSVGDGYKLTTGGHRLEVLRGLGRETLVIGVDVVIRDEDEEGARASEIFENIGNAGLTALDRAIFIAEAKDIYNKTRLKIRQSKRKDIQVQFDKESPETGLFLSERFTDQVAKRVNLGRSQIFEALAIAKALNPEVIPQLRGTMIEDNQNELKQLAALDGGSQRKAVAAIRGGEVKTVAQARVAIGVDKPKTDDLQARIYADLLDRWSKASNKTKRQFMADVGLVYAEKDEKA